MNKKRQGFGISLESRPCHHQTEEEIGAYYRACKVGDLMVVRHTQGGYCEYELFRVDRFNENRSRVYAPFESGRSAFYTKHGRHCFHPKGQTSLRRPTIAILDFCETYEMPIHNARGQITTEQARKLLPTD